VTEGLLGFALLMTLCFAGIPLTFAMIAVGVGGLAMSRGFEPAMLAVSQQAIDWTTNYSLIVLPMFILMGSFVQHAKLADELYEAANGWLGHRPGGLAEATIAASAGLAAVSGTSLATTAIMSKVSIPAMRRFRYSDSFAAGTCAAGGTLGILIPPSIPLAIYGILTETDISQLFIAGLLPGILLTVLFIIAIRLLGWLQPQAFPAAERTPWPLRWALLARTWGIIVLILVVLGGMYAGVFTPTEAAGIGAGGALLFAVIRRKLTRRQFLAALVDAGLTTSNILLIGIGALVFSTFLTLCGMTGALAAWVQSFDVSPIGVVAVICLVYIVLGCVFESLGMLLMTVPVFFPIVAALGIDLVWFGIIVVIVVEIGLITPPVGINVLVVKGLFPDIPMWSIYRGIMPFLIANLVCLVLLFMFPAIATWLPQMLR